MALKVANICFTAKINCSINLPVHSLESFLYDAIRSKYFKNCIVIKCDDPRYTILLYSNGNCIVTGVKARKEAKVGLAHLVKELDDIGFESTYSNLKVTNITASAQIKKKINYQSIVSRNKNANYEVEVFPGLIYQYEGSKARALLFHTQKVIITGAKTIKQIRLFYKHLINTVI